LRLSQILKKKTKTNSSSYLIV